MAEFFLCLRGRSGFVHSVFILMHTTQFTPTLILWLRVFDFSFEALRTNKSGSLVRRNKPTIPYYLRIRQTFADVAMDFPPTADKAELLCQLTDSGIHFLEHCQRVPWVLACLFLFWRGSVFLCTHEMGHRWHTPGGSTTWLWHILGRFPLHAVLLIADCCDRKHSNQMRYLGTVECSKLKV